LAEVDEIMVSSDFVRRSIQRVTDKPVLLVPLPVGDVPDSGLQRADFGLDEEAFLFLTSFDFNSFVARKNPIAVIEAFRRAFPDDRSDVQLLVKSSNGHRHPEKLRELLNAAGNSPRIVIRDEVIDRPDVQALQRCADAYVSMHRAEGFGLGLAECMSLGKPVIATAWSGNLEFMTADNSCLVDYRLVPVNQGEYVHHEGQRWAEPNIDHAAAYMRRLVDDRAFAAAMGARAALDVRERLAPEAVAQRIIDRLEAFPARAWRMKPTPAHGRRQILHQRPELDEPPAYGALRPSSDDRIDDGRCPRRARISPSADARMCAILLLQRAFRVRRALWQDRCARAVTASAKRRMRTVASSGCERHGMQLP
jgi:glycosyltransferase involved in cell wall biosynthesis